MGMDLDGKGGYFRWLNYAWGEVVVMARLCGWQPLVVAVFDDGERDETVYYLSNDGQLVTARDARNFAAALERSLEPKMQKKLKARKRPRFDPWFFTKDGAAYLREFIAFLKAGSFRIY